MADKKRPELPILTALEEAFERARPRVTPIFPYDPKTQEIRWPQSIDKELRQLVLTGRKAEAVKRVTELTGAGLRLSKDYVDSLVGK